MSPPAEAGTLFIVATPIGNLADLTDRTRATVCGVDLVVAEDTRRSRKLLSHVGAEAECISYHAQSPPGRPAVILDRLASGQDVALLTDAGTPSVSDPGGHLVAAWRKQGGVVVPVPGPSAVVTALSASGLPADRFTFLGFPPRKGKGRSNLMDMVANSPLTVVLFEAPQRLGGLLGDLEQRCGGERDVVVARELTKLHEEIRAGTLADMAVYYRDHAVRGEITVVIGPGESTVELPDPDVLQERARELLAAGSSRRDAAATLAAETGISRNEAYGLVTSL